MCLCCCVFGLCARPPSRGTVISRDRPYAGPPSRRTALSPDRPKFRVFFFLSRLPFSFFFSLSLGVLPRRVAKGGPRSFALFFPSRLGPTLRGAHPSGSPPFGPPKCGVPPFGVPPLPPRPLPLFSCISSHVFFCPVCHFLSCPNVVFLSRVSLFLSQKQFVLSRGVFLVPTPSIIDALSRADRTIWLEDQEALARGDLRSFPELSRMLSDGARSPVGGDVSTPAIFCGQHVNVEGDHCLHQCRHLGCRVGASNPGPVQIRQARRRSTID